MNRKKWIAGICFVGLLIYLYMKQKTMLAIWLGPESDSISENPVWFFGKISDGQITYIREFLNYAEGWDALLALWPLHLSLVIVSVTSGVFGGCFFRDRYNAKKYEKFYRDEIQQARAQRREAQSMEDESMIRFKKVEEKEFAVKQQMKAVLEKESEIEKIVESRIQGIINQYQSLQKEHQSLREDHKKRGAKLENVERENNELKKKLFHNDKELIKLQDENLEFIKSARNLKHDE